MKQGFERRGRWLGQHLLQLSVLHRQRVETLLEDLRGDTVHARHYGGRLTLFVAADTARTNETQHEQPETTFIFAFWYLELLRISRIKLRHPRRVKQKIWTKKLERSKATKKSRRDKRAEPNSSHGTHAANGNVVLLEASPHRVRKGSSSLRGSLVERRKAGRRHQSVAHMHRARAANFGDGDYLIDGVLPTLPRLVSLDVRTLAILRCERVSTEGVRSFECMPPEPSVLNTPHINWDVRPRRTSRTGSGAAESTALGREVGGLGDCTWQPHQDTKAEPWRDERLRVTTPLGTPRTQGRKLSK